MLNHAYVQHPLDLNRISTPRIYQGGGYSFTHSLPWYEMQRNDQIPSPAALIPGKLSAVPVVLETCWDQESVFRKWRR
jgi:hypothetical protein